MFLIEAREENSEIKLVDLISDLCQYMKIFDIQYLGIKVLKARKLRWILFDLLFK